MKKHKKGFTLIETVVVVAIISILAFFGVENIIEFQKNSLLEGTANELASTLRQARTKSLAGELLEGDILSCFTQDGLPKYGVRIAGQTYILFREYQHLCNPLCDSSCYPSLNSQDLETFAIGDQLLLSSSGGDAVFARVTGESNPVSFDLQRKDGRGSRRIIVGDKGVTISRL